MRKFLAEGTATVQFAYPVDLANYLEDVWPAKVEERLRRADDGGLTDELPSHALLERLLATCYQASLMADEGRPVTFRLMFRSPDRFDVLEGPPDGLHRLAFEEPRPYTPHELARLAPAAVFSRALIGVEPDPEDGFRIWGIIQSGSRWLQDHYGGRRPSCPLPASLVVQVTGPGTLTVDAGSMVVARLEGGRVLGRPMDLYASHWLPEHFHESLVEIGALHESAYREAVRAGKCWGRLEPAVIRLVTEQMLKRLVATIRDSHHGGLLAILPPGEAERIERMQGEDDDPPIRMKYLFRADGARGRFRHLILSLLAILAEAHPECAQGKGRLVGWPEFQSSMIRELASHDEAILEVAYTAAGLAAADGAVVLTKRFELIGFGGEISSALTQVPAVARALDVEGRERLFVSTDSVGTRHRAAYRLVNEIRDALAIVISQDGGVRFTAWKDGAVTYWSQ